MLRFAVNEDFDNRIVRGCSVSFQPSISFSCKM